MLHAVVFEEAGENLVAVCNVRRRGADGVQASIGGSVAQHEQQLGENKGREGDAEEKREAGSGVESGKRGEGE